MNNAKSVLRKCREYAAKYPNRHADWKSVWTAMGKGSSFRCFPDSGIWFFTRESGSKKRMMGMPSKSIDFKYCDEVVSSIRHTGWYADAFNDSTYRGICARIGKFWFGGYEDKQSESVIIELYPLSDERIAAHLGDGLAQYDAEESKEADVKFQAEQEIETLETEIKETWSQIKETMAGIRASSLHPSVCKELRSAIRGHVQDIRDMKKKIAEYQDNPWKACPSW